MAATGKRGNRRATPWYQDGLHFTCTRCGRCCTGAPGYVWLDKKEIQRIARFLRMPAEEFQKQFCRRVFVRVSLVERANGDCVFFTPAGCRIYQVRPLQCTSFPFWKQSLKSRADWEALKQRCPGVGEGRLYSPEEIEAIHAGKKPTTQG